MENISLLEFSVVLAVLFLGLKISGVVTWSWPVILAPIWAPAIALGLLVGLALIWCWVVR